eukprot:TRINITY_DN8918_c0_g1_i2.p1 TRINITY_DN8918_c0_g1~~TRINITY_DN8918_c0_g1_i2.p1  ORF type:complete len:320 (-),score=53.30 TRINITY_DN8918_c0_g1_i2:2-961(-)
MEFVVSAPGKIILFGEHAVVYGKTAIASCISLRTKGHFTVTPFAAAPTDETVVLRARLQELDIDTQITYAQIRSLDGSLQTDVDQPPSQELLAQVKNVYSSFNNSMEVLLFLYAALKHLSKKEISEELTMSFDSELPLGAGLGSSAAFSVVAAAGLLKYFGLCAGENSSEDDGASALDKINSWAFLAERIFHANPSGVDNAVSTYGHAIVFANRRTAVTEMPSLNIMLVNTCIPRNTKTLVQGVRVRFDSHSKTMSHILDAIDLIGIECVDLFSKSSETLSFFHHDMCMNIYPNLKECWARLAIYIIFAKSFVLETIAI